MDFQLVATDPDADTFVFDIQTFAGTPSTGANKFGIDSSTGVIISNNRSFHRLTKDPLNTSE